MRWVRQLLLVPLGVVVSHSSLHAQCPDGSPPPCRVAPHVVVDSDALVILPFRVSGPPEVQYLREGVADLLDLALDGVAGWRPVHPRTVLNAVRATAPIDPTEAMRLARTVGAGYVIIGTVVAVGQELRVQAELYDVERRHRATAVRARGDLAVPAPVVDSIADGLARQRLLTRSSQVRHSLEEYTTSSPPALQAYLAAEQLARNSQWQSALDSLQRAIAHDSSFGLAYYRLSLVRRYGGNLGGLAVADLRYAMRHLDRLPRRQRDLLLLASAQLTGLRAEALDRAADIEVRYPDDAEAQLEVGQTYYHQGLLTGMPPERAVQPFERALQLEPAFPEPYLLATQLLCMSGDTAKAWALTRAFRTVAPHYFNSVNLELALRIGLRGEDPAALPRSDLSFLVASQVLRILDRDPGRAVVLADSILALLSDPDRLSSDRLSALVRRHLLLLSQGRYSAAWNALRTATAIDPADWGVLAGIVLHAAVTNTHLDEGRVAVLQLAGHDPDPLDWALVGWYAVVQHEPVLQAEADSALAQPDTLYRAYDEAHRAGLHGLIALATGETAQARRFLESAVMVRPWVTTWLGSWLPDARFAVVLARLELNAGALESAERRLYDSFLPEALPWRAEAEELRGEIATQRGDTVAAIRAYRNFIGLWKNADPELQPRVAAARAALARLGGS